MSFDYRQAKGKIMQAVPEFYRNQMKDLDLNGCVDVLLQWVEVMKQNDEENKKLGEYHNAGLRKIMAAYRLQDSLKEFLDA